MKKFGLIGGTGPESTILYYHDINYEVNRRTNGKTFPEFSLESVNLCHVLDYCKEEKYDELTEYLLCAVNNLAKSGAEFAALSANTLHIVFDSLKKQSPIPLVSIVDVTCAEVKRRGFKKVGLLGTIFTMKGEFFSKPFIEQGIHIVTPSEKQWRL